MTHGLAPASASRPDLVRDGAVELFAVQSQVVRDVMERDGASMVRLAYVDEKYGDAAWSFRCAYAWMSRQLEGAVARPEGAESPVWLYRDARWATPAPGSVAMRLEVPAGEVALFDLRLWGRVLALEYLGRDEADERRFGAGLARQGLWDTVPAFKTAFHPLVRREVTASWDRLLASAEDCPETYLQGAVWQLRRSWVVDEHLV